MWCLFESFHVPCDRARRKEIDRTQQLRWWRDITKELRINFPTISDQSPFTFVSTISWDPHFLSSEYWIVNSWNFAISSVSKKSVWTQFFGWHSRSNAPWQKRTWFICVSLYIIYMYILKSFQTRCLKFQAVQMKIIQKLDQNLFT